MLHGNGVDGLFGLSTRQTMVSPASQNKMPVSGVFDQSMGGNVLRNLAQRMQVSQLLHQIQTDRISSQPALSTRRRNPHNPREPRFDGHLTRMFQTYVVSALEGVQGKKRHHTQGIRHLPQQNTGKTITGGNRGLDDVNAIRGDGFLDQDRTRTISFETPVILSP